MKLKSIFLVVCTLSVVAFGADARVRCKPDGMGGTKCMGYNTDGEYVSLRSRTNSLGFTTTQGRIGNRMVNLHSGTNETDGQNVQLQSRAASMGRIENPGRISNTRTVRYDSY